MPARKTLTLVKLANSVEKIEDQVRFLQNHRLIPQEMKCPKCQETIQTIGKS